MKDRLLDYFLIILAITMGSFHLYQLKFVFSEKTKLYSKQYPEDINSIITEFKNESSFYNKDTSKINSLKIVVLEDKKLWFAGYCDQLSNTLFINKIGKNLRTVIFHELGHCIFGYKHIKNDPIMDYSISLSKEVSEDVWVKNKIIFFNKDYSYSWVSFKDELNERVFNNPYGKFLKDRIF